MGVVFLLICAIVVIITLLEHKGDDPKAIRIDRKLFATDAIFNVGAIGICGILAVMYILFW